MDNLTPITREEMLMNDEPLTPITREEKILAGEDLNPVTRREYFLKKYRHAGGDVMVEGLSVTENGTYTAPEGKAYSPVDVAVPLPENAYLLKEASGSLVSFNDGADLPMPSFVCNIDAVQDLHGYDAPWVGGAGKNKLPNNLTTITAFGVTYVTQEDGSIIANGTSTGWANAQIATNLLLKGGEQYILSGIPNVDGTYVTIVRADGTGGSWSSTFATPSLDFSFEEDTLVNVRVSASSGTVLNNAKYEPMIRLATETDPTFAPYSNICPISGHTGLNAWVFGKNLANPATITTLYPTGNSGSYPNQIRSSSNARSVIAEVTPNTTYTISKKAGQRFRLAFTAEEPANGVVDYGYEWNDTGTTITVTSPSNAKYMVVLFLSSNVDTDTEEDMLSTLQIELGETASTYEPYNPNSQTISVSWQTEAGEVFGGYVDLVSGVLTVTHGIVNCKNLTFNPNTSTGGLHWADITGSATNIEPISNKLKYLSRGADGWLSTIPCVSIRADDGRVRVYGSLSDFADGGSYENTMVCYELATPITYQLTPQQIKSLVNDITNAWCSTGDVDIDYFAKEVEG